MHPANPDFETVVRESFSQQAVMRLFGARIETVEPGYVEVRLPFRRDLTQQHGFLHAGVSTAIADSAAGYAALSLLPAGASVLTVEFKCNLVAPATGGEFVARGRVVRPGNRLFVCTSEVASDSGGVCLVGLQTVAGRTPRE